MPHVAGLPRGTWSLSTTHQWSYLVPAPDIADSFADFCARCLRILAPLAQVRAVRWSSVSKGEDVVVERFDVGLNQRCLDQRVKASCPDDGYLLVVDLDLEVVGPNQQVIVLPGRASLVVEDERLESPGNGFYVRLVLHADVLSPITAGAVSDNRRISDLNRVRLAAVLGQFLGQLNARFNGGRDSFCTASGYSSPDFESIKSSGLDRWEEALVVARNTDDVGNVLRLELHAGDLDRIFGSSEIGVQLRRRYVRYIEALRAPWESVGDSEVREMARGAAQSLARAGNQLSIEPWRTLSRSKFGEPRLVDRPTLGSVVDLASQGALACLAHIEEEKQAESWINVYVVGSAAVASSDVIRCYLLAPLLESSDGLHPLFDLWLHSDQIRLSADGPLIAGS